MFHGEDLFFATFFLGMIGFFILIGIILIVCYILQAIGLYQISQREGRADIAWLAWIPVVSTFLLTMLVEKDVHPDLRGKLSLILALSIAFSMVTSWIFYYMVSLIPIGIIIYAFYHLAKKYVPNPVFHLAIAVVSIGSSIPFQLFWMRDRKLPE